MDLGNGNHGHEPEERDIYLSYADSYMMLEVDFVKQIGETSKLRLDRPHVAQYGKQPIQRDHRTGDEYLLNNTNNRIRSPPLGGKGSPELNPRDDRKV
ncbi:hypothetical protein BV898_15164 [Hypsibius exemplaris]|uniref:Uncharacterized protein n=1 Tax=Hypsibius exemplaris TaxID=2072580 RepID=A0A9X6NC41_HYPEX|nr:hypothetical protein BV898_15164 [Hypsibius exemplaris]